MGLPKLKCFGWPSLPRMGKGILGGRAGNPGYPGTGKINID